MAQQEPEPTISQLLKKLADNQRLTSAETARAMHLMLQNTCSSEEIAGFLMGLRSRKESTEELVGLARAMREQCIPVALYDPNSVDIVGTGGDGTGTFNISTAAAFVCAAAGVSVAKHGNRSVSSRCGSSDVLEKLGIKTTLSAPGIERCLEKTGLAFMFAPIFHTALRHVMPVRRALGVRTCFNILGPLCNPAGVRRHFIGAFSEDVAETMAHILDALDSTHIVVVHSEDGMDEISISAPTTMFSKFPGQDELKRETIQPEDFGLRRAPIETILGDDAVENSAIIRRVFAGETGPARDIVSLNAAGALFAAGRAPSIGDGVLLAQKALDDGKTEALLAKLADFTQSLAAV